MSSVPNGLAFPNDNEVRNRVAAVNRAAVALLAAPSDVDRMINLRIAELGLSDYLSRTTGSDWQQTLTKMRGRMSLLSPEEQALATRLGLYGDNAPGHKAWNIVADRLQDIHCRCSSWGADFPLSQEELNEAPNYQYITNSEKRLGDLFMHNGMMRRPRLQGQHQVGQPPLPRPAPGGASSTSSAPNGLAFLDSGEVQNRVAAVNRAAEALLADPSDVDRMINLRVAERELNGYLRRATGSDWQKTLTRMRGRMSLLSPEEQTLARRLGLYGDNAPGHKAWNIVADRLQDIHRRCSSRGAPFPLSQEELNEAPKYQYITDSEERLGDLFMDNGMIRRPRLQGQHQVGQPPLPHSPVEETRTTKHRTIRKSL